jgi:hypothetical protein
VNDDTVSEVVAVIFWLIVCAIVVGITALVTQSFTATLAAVFIVIVVWAIGSRGDRRHDAEWYRMRD